MTIYFQTARQMAGNPEGKAVRAVEPVRFTARGWDEFSSLVRAARPDIGPLVTRLQAPQEDLPRHPTLEYDGQPLALAWTAVECRILFGVLSGLVDGPLGKAYDFWDFTALVCSGVVEDGICWY